MTTYNDTISEMISLQDVPMSKVKYMAAISESITLTDSRDVGPYHLSISETIHIKDKKVKANQPHINFSPVTFKSTASPSDGPLIVE